MYEKCIVGNITEKKKVVWSLENVISECVFPDFIHHFVGSVNNTLSVE